MTTDDSTSKGGSPADIKVEVATIKETPNPRGGKPSPPNRRPTTGPKFGASRPGGSPTNPAKISLGQRKGTQEIEASRKPNAERSSEQKKGDCLRQGKGPGQWKQSRHRGHGSNH